MPPPIKYTSSWLSTKGKIVSKYCNISKTPGRGSIHPPPPSLLEPRWGMNLLVRKVKIQNDPNKQITSTVLLKALYLEATLTLKFPRFAANTARKLNSLAVLISCTELYVAYSKLCRGKLFNKERKPHAISEKRHKISKFANYQNIIVRNSRFFDRHVFVSSQDR